MFENSKIEVIGNVNKKYFGTLLTDLLKAFDCIGHDLLITKRNGYVLSRSESKLINT